MASIQDRITTNDLPGAPNGIVKATPGIVTNLRANPFNEYIAGGVGGSGQWFTNYSDGNVTWDQVRPSSSAMMELWLTP
jgi:hypothetical protein